jgi:pimeloyl-ACP methyl ester carboxylesterase
MVHVNRYPLKSIRQGAGPPVVFLHGWGASWHHWQFSLPAVARAGFLAYAPDLLGHGESVKPASQEDYLIPTFVESFSDWVENIGLKKLLLVGHSMGGYVCLEYARSRPEHVAGLVLINPLYSPDQFFRSGGGPRLRWRALRLPNLGEFFFRLAPEWLIRAGLDFNRFDSPALPVETRCQMARDYKRASPRIVHTIFSIEDLYPFLSKMRVPAMVVWGDKDLTLAPSSFQRLRQSLPDCQAHCFVGRGHSPHLAESGRFNDLLLTFARSHLC